MSYHPDDTIAAIATAAGSGARGVVRVSGRHSLEAVATCFRRDCDLPITALRRATTIHGRVRVLLDYLSHERSNPPCNGRESWVPCDLFVWPNDRSYTREPVAELHTIGSTPLLQAVLAAVCGAGARLAEPGEFTLRAFLAGRLDLTQAEAVLGVIDAQGPRDLDAALVQLAGGLAEPLAHLRDELMQSLADLEAGLDFAEEDIEFTSREQLLDRLLAAGKQLRETGEQLASRLVATPLAQVVLSGPPNAGKSSLFNAMVERCGCKAAAHSPPPAIVSDERGTTRDYLTATIDIDGVRCELVDTAGVTAGAELGAENGDQAESFAPVSHRSTLAINRSAQAMTAERRRCAALSILCVDVATDGVIGAPDDLIVLTKADLAARSPSRAADLPADVPVVVTSSRTGQGLDLLCNTLRRLLTHEKAATRGQFVAATADRCRDSLRLAEAAVVRAADLVAARGGDELVAAELRDALNEIGRMTGAVYTDDLLDRIFKTFCIGK